MKIFFWNLRYEKFTAASCNKNTKTNRVYLLQTSWRQYDNECEIDYDIFLK